MKSLTLWGLDGANPLAFLAACGATRLASLRWPDLTPTLHWERRGLWRAELGGLPELSAAEFAHELCSAPAVSLELFELLGKNLTVAPSAFSAFAKAAALDPLGADFCAAFGSEVCTDDKGDRIRYTDHCFITGSGHQDFLGTYKQLRGCCDEEKVRQALFEGIADSDKGLSFRWSPDDARYYARRWNNPGPEGAWTSWGANRLAFEALPLFPTQPSEKRLRTTGFRRVKGKTDFSWPIWGSPIGCDEMKSLFSFAELHRENLDGQSLRSMGVAAVFRSIRVRIGSGANFKVSYLPARSV